MMTLAEPIFAVINRRDVPNEVEIFIHHCRKKTVVLLLPGENVNCDLQTSAVLHVSLPSSSSLFTVNCLCKKKTRKKKSSLVPPTSNVLNIVYKLKMNSSRFSFSGLAVYNILPAFCCCCCNHACPYLFSSFATITNKIFPFDSPSPLSGFFKTNR